MVRTLLITVPSENVKRFLQFFCIFWQKTPFAGLTGGGIYRVALAILMRLSAFRYPDMTGPGLLDPKLDLVFKRLFAGAPDLLADLINAVRSDEPPIQKAYQHLHALSGDELACREAFVRERAICDEITEKAEAEARGRAMGLIEGHPPESSVARQIWRITAICGRALAER